MLLTSYQLSNNAYNTMPKIYSITNRTEEILVNLLCKNTDYKWQIKETEQYINILNILFNCEG